MMTALSGYPQVSHVQRYSTKPGMIKTDDAFQGMVLKGVGPELIRVLCRSIWWKGDSCVQRFGFE